LRVDKYLSDSFLIQNGLKQGPALSPLIFNSTLEYAIMKAEKTLLNGANKTLAYADDVNLLGNNIDTINLKRTRNHSIKEAGVEINVEKNSQQTI
jgi:hypothetical protein